MQDPRNDAASDQQHQREKRGDLSDGERDRHQDRLQVGAILQAAFQDRRQRRQHHQHQDRRQILDDEPADGDAAAFGIEQAPLLHRAQQHHRGGNRERQTEHQTGGNAPTQRHAQGHAKDRRDGYLRHRAGQRDGLHRHQILEREMQADTEHQQDDADFSQFVGKADVGDKAGSGRTDHHAGEQIADQRRDAEALSDRAEHKGQDQTHHDR
jgi:hypothetical protein